ncbi:fibronectin type III domain-containing protein, partial [bacterium]|nr:fibronectin type III domain-containing protein [bacterium]
MKRPQENKWPHFNVSSSIRRFLNSALINSKTRPLLDRVELLEDRSVPTATPIWHTDTHLLEIISTGGETITLSSAPSQLGSFDVVTLNGSPINVSGSLPIPAPLVTGIKIDASSGSTGDIIDLSLIRSDAFLNLPSGPGQFPVTILGTSGNDTIHGSFAADQVFGNLGNDFIDLGPGNDTTDGAEGANLDGGEGNDTILGGEGNDTIDAATQGGEGADVIFGQAGDDTIEDKFGLDILLGGDGADRIVDGGEGAILIGGAGADTLIGSPSHDILITDSTIFDNDLSANALKRIASQWFGARDSEGRLSDSPLNTAYTDTVRKLLGELTTGTNYPYFLNSSTVINEFGSIDIVEGDPSNIPTSKGNDWFFVLDPDVVNAASGWDNGEWIADSRNLPKGIADEIFIPRMAQTSTLTIPVPALLANDDDGGTGVFPLMAVALETVTPGAILATDFGGTVETPGLAVNTISVNWGSLPTTDSISFAYAFVNLTSFNGDASTVTVGSADVTVTQVDVLPFAAIADIDGDGLTDIVRFDPSTGNITIQSNRTATQQVWGLASPLVAWLDWQIGDFTGDGRDDLMARSGLSGEWFLWKSAGTHLLSPVKWSKWGLQGDRWVRPIQGDFNGDGKTDLFSFNTENFDLLVAASTGASFDIRAWNQIRAYAQQIIADFGSVSMNTIGFNVGDFNGDGKDDVLVRDGLYNRWAFVLSEGYKFTDLSLPQSFLGWTSIYYVGDFDNNGTDDIVDWNASISQWQLATRAGNQFILKQDMGSDLAATAGFMVHDVNWDGYQDLIRVDPSDSTHWNVLIGTSGGFIGMDSHEVDIILNATRWANLQEEIVFDELNPIDLIPTDNGAPLSSSGITANPLIRGQFWEGLYSQDVRIEFDVDGNGVPESGLIVSPDAFGNFSYRPTSLILGTRYDVRTRIAYTDPRTGNVRRSHWGEAASFTYATNSIGLSAMALSGTQIRLDWADNTLNRTGYIVDVSTDGSNFSTIDTLQSSTSNSYVVQHLSPNHSYTFRVRNYVGDTAIVHSYSNPASTRTLEVLMPPSDLIASQIASSSLQLSWTNNSVDATFVLIERSTNGIDFTGLGAVSANINTYSVSNLSFDTSYVFRIRALKLNGISAYSIPCLVTTLPEPLTAPAGLSATRVAPNQINLHWIDTTTSETGFTVQYSTDGLTYSTYAGSSVIGPNVTDYPFSASPNTQYWFRVKANGGSDSEYSSLTTATTATALIVPSSPINLQAKAVSNNAINLTWTDTSANENGFRLERSADGIQFTIVSATISANVTSYLDSGSLLPKKPYWYRLLAYNTGVSGYSNQSVETTMNSLPGAPVGLTAIATSTSQVSLAWTNVANNATGITIIRTGSGASQTWNKGPSEYNLLDSSLMPNSTYTYQVISTNSVGSSVSSPSISVTTRSSPNAPSGLVAKNIYNTQVDLAWIDNSNNELRFDVFYRSSAVAGLSDWTYKATTSGPDITNLLVAGLMANTPYEFKVAVQHNFQSLMATELSSNPLSI